jgi:aspartate-semialdehyde dehydrogenase
MGLAPLHRAFGVKRAVVSPPIRRCRARGGKPSTSLRDQARKVLAGEPITDLGGFPNQIAFNVLANNWKIEERGYSNEEWKVIKETHKMLDPKIQLSVTTVRVPTAVGHGESVWIETEKPITRGVRAGGAGESARRAGGGRGLASGRRHCPMPILAAGREDTLVGRIRGDLFNDHALAFWVVGDNLWKGAALNAVQIAETLIAKGWLKPRSLMRVLLLGAQGSVGHRARPDESRPYA